jgi:hypothetical protein
MGVQVQYIGIMASFLSLLILFIIFYHDSPQDHGSKIKNKILTSFLLLISYFFFTHKESAFRSVGVIIFLLGLRQYRPLKQNQEIKSKIWLTTSMTFTLFVVLYYHFSLDRYTIRFSLLFSSIMSSLFGAKRIYGPFVLGIPTVFLLFLYFSLDQISRKRLTLIKFFVSIMISFFLLFIQIYIYSPQMILILGLSIICFFQDYSPYVEYKGEIQSRRSDAFLWVHWIIASAISILLLMRSVPSFEKEKTIVFHNEGLLEWNIPKFNNYGFSKSADFGNLRRLYLPGLKYNVLGTDSISSSCLSQADVLVVINPLTPFTTEEQKSVTAFVKKGGSLLVLGDHTDLAGIMTPLNQLIKDFDISFNFDSAIPMDPDWKWQNCIDTLPHSIFTDLPEIFDYGISIGASLSLDSWKSKPLWVGRAAFSDQGNILKGDARLGDMKYSRGEQFGGLILAAERKYGKGKVLVFGDTSSFQNNPLLYTYPMISNIFAYLSNGQHHPSLYKSGIVLVLFFLFSFLLSLKLIKFDLNEIHLILPLVLSLFIIQYVPARYNISKNTPENLALIDFSHFNSSSIRFKKGMDDHLFALSQTLIRNGYWPSVMRNWDEEKIQKSRLFIIAGPRKIISPRETRETLEFINQGGILILSTGWFNRKSVKCFNESLNFSVENILLGSAHLSHSYFNIINEWPKDGNAPEIWETLQTGDSGNSSKIKEKSISYDDRSTTESYYNPDVILRESWALDLKHKDWIPLISAWGYPVCSLRQYGKGWILVISDSRFLNAENLETENYSSSKNIHFLSQILHSIRSEKRVEP